MKPHTRDFVIFLSLTIVIQIGAFLIWVLTDIVVTSLQLQPNTNLSFKLIPISMNNVEWYQSLFLIGNCMLIFLGIREWGVYTEKLNLGWKARMILIAAMLGIGSGLWDAIYFFEAGMTSDLVWWWNAPFSLSPLDMVFIITTGDNINVLMNSEFGMFFALLRFVIFLPVMCYVVLDVYMKEVVLQE